MPAAAPSDLVAPSTSLASYQVGSDSGRES